MTEDDKQLVHDSWAKVMPISDDTVASALLWTLERGLGDGFTEETRNAWIKTYTLLSTTMKEAAAEPATA